MTGGKALWVEVDTCDPEVRRRAVALAAIVKMANPAASPRWDVDVSGPLRISMDGTDARIGAVTAALIVNGIPCRGGGVTEKGESRLVWEFGTGTRLRGFSLLWPTGR